MLIIGVITHLIAGIAVWLLYYTLELGLNGALFKRHILSYVYEELLWILPFHPARENYIKEIVHSCDDGYIGDFEYKEVREYNLYNLVGRSVLPGFWHFVFTHMCIPLCPLAIFLMIWSYFS
jgi:hypothetical protein